MKLQLSIIAGFGRRPLALLFWCGVVGFFVNSANAGRSTSLFTLACSPTNDLFVVLRDNGLKPKRYETPEEAIVAARPGSVTLLLADEYPTKVISLSTNIFAQAAAKNLRLYVEFPSFVPGVTFDIPRATKWERFVVRGKDLSPDLPPGRLLMAHDCSIQPTTAQNPLIVAARVAGYDSAIYGIPDSAQPVLFSMEGGRVLVATTKLSNFVTGRCAPAREWNALWHYILGQLAQTEVQDLKWQPRVQPRYGPQESLPADFEKSAFRNAARWVYHSRLLIARAQWPSLEALMKQNVELTAAPEIKDPVGDGQFGIMEGFASDIRPDGNQPRRTPVRADCQAETAMVLAMDWVVNGRRVSRASASNLLDFLYFDADFCSGPRGNPKHPAFGLISWGSISHAWTVANYGDDNARAMLATMLAVSALKSDRWNEPLLRALMANLRTTGKLGFRGDRIDIPALEENGWRHFHDAETINYSPHFEAYSWACFLWAYRATSDREFLDKTKTAIQKTMQAFPDHWRWNDNMERAHMLLCLAWLVRLEDTTEHRHWLQVVANDLIDIQDKTGAIPERFRGTPGSHYQIPQSNEAYGTGETPLLQENGDPVTDQLYVSGFALLALHEAAGTVNDSKLKAAEDKLAEYLCRIQIHSKSIPYLDGTWFRAFDFEKWEPWASSGDAGWGAWSVEAGWAQAWTAGVLALRDRKATIWELTAHTRINEKMPLVCEQMSENEGGPWRSPASNSGTPQKQ